VVLQHDLALAGLGKFENAPAAEIGQRARRSQASRANVPEVTMMAARLARVGGCPGSSHSPCCLLGFQGGLVLSQRSLDKASGETIYSYFYLIKDRLK
jgi:hypothetical protein